MLDLISIILIITAIFGYINARYLKFVPGIGLMLIALVVSAVFILSDLTGLLSTSITNEVKHLVLSVDFNHLVMNGMLGVLLFAAAIHVEIDDLLEQKYIILSMATVGLVVSVFITSISIYYFAGFVGINLPYIYALLFGALISPTDPIAVLAIFRSVGAPKSQEIKLTGESLFNDGLSIVIFIVVLGVASGSMENPTVGGISMLLIQEVLGGIILGLITGYIACYMISKIDSYDVEILITLALVFGIYMAASHLHVSNPIAAVIAGLLLGNHGKRLAMSDKTIEHLDNFWHLIDEILNAILFVLLGFELIVVTLSIDGFILGVVAIVITLFARFIGVGILVNALKQIREFSPHAVKVLTWAGLRGGVSVALALSLPESEYRETILIMTYTVVVFSIVGQGLTLGRLIEKYKSKTTD
jgi:CPA1 family monovalent cation:H+ antiporter